MTMSFDSGQQGFTAANALFLARACHAAYMPNAKIKPAATALGLRDVRPFHSDKGTDGFVAKGAGCVLVAFRGTEMNVAADLLTDVQIRQVPGLGGKVHSGNTIALDSVWEGVLADIRSRALADDVVWVTGHSLGGALATIAAARLHSAGVQPVRAVTFGAPRVGDDPFRRAYKPALFRVVNHRDIVPHLPTDRRVVSEFVPLLYGALNGSLSIPNLDYTHAGTMKYLDGDGNLDEGRTEASIISDAVYQALGRLAALRQIQKLKQLDAKVPQSIADHALSDYLAVLTKVVG